MFFEPQTLLVLTGHTSSFEVDHWTSRVPCFLFEAETCLSPAACGRESDGFFR